MQACVRPLQWWGLAVAGNTRARALQATERTVGARTARGPPKRNFLREILSHYLLTGQQA